jgi:carbonic anhydrase
MGIEQFIKGNISFRSSKFKHFEDDFETLVKKGQTPEVLFIGCSDSRVVPDLIVDSKPGDMFILRNVGNFVPPFKADNDFHGSAAAIEYAVSVLNVKHIIVCGHSYCGACQALYSDLGDDVGLIHVRKWLELGYKAKEYVIKEFGNLSKEDIYRKTEKTSIVYQLENLLTYPEVKRKVDENLLTIHGWYYKIEDGSIEEYNQTNRKFEPLRDFI